MAQIETAATIKSEEKQRELQERVLKATFDQLKSQLDEDLEKVKAALPTSNAVAIETAQDMKYMKDRQLKLSKTNDPFSFDVSFVNMLRLSWKLNFHTVVVAQMV